MAELTGHDRDRTVRLSVTGEAHLTLGTVGPGQYLAPALTSEAVMFVGVEFATPPNPGGPTQVFTFQCVERGASTIVIPHSVIEKSFSLVIECG